MDSKLAHDELSYHYSDGKLSPGRQREEKILRGVTVLFPDKVIKVTHAQAERLSYQNLYFYTDFFLFSLRPGIYCYNYLTKEIICTV